jgi:hypothetical protein
MFFSSLQANLKARAAEAAANVAKVEEASKVSFICFSIWLSSW